jgi:hypothetical protein
MSNFTELFPVVVALIHAKNGRKDVTKVVGAFREYADASKNADKRKFFDK